MSGIRRIGLDDVLRMLDAWQPRRRIDAFHVHHTWRPRQRDFRGLSTIEAMRRYHMREMGMRDIAQHLTIDPAGGIWTGRAFDLPPGSARGYNGNSLRGPFMIEMVGDFDEGQDRFEGEQKRIAQAVVAAVLRKFGLGAQAVRFHNEFSTKSCPGSGIDLGTFRSEIAALLEDGVALRSRMSDARLSAAEARGWAAAARGEEEADPQALSLEAASAEPPEDEASGYVIDYIADEIERGAGAADDAYGDDARAGGPPPFDTAALLPYVVNLSRGVLSGEGRISSGDDWPAGDGGFVCTRSSLRAIAERHLPAYIAQCRADGRKPKLMFYVHGGLVRESAALKYAQSMAPWWLAHGVYPIFFIWESGLLETMLPSWAASRGAAAARAPTDTLLEWGTQLLARKVWARMKQHAEDGALDRIPSQDDKAGGAWLLAETLKPLLKNTPELELHAVGHSTGPILLSTFMPLLLRAGHAFRSMSYLAPAIRTDVFTRRVLPWLRTASGTAGIDELTMYTMTDGAERADNVAWVYRKSLLYYVRNACEDHTDGRVLGLAHDLVDDAALRKTFGDVERRPTRLSYRSADRRIGVEFSPEHDEGVRNPLTSAVRHGCFDNNADTLFAVLGRVLGAPVAQNVADAERQFPDGKEFRKCSTWGGRDDDEETRAFGEAAVGGCPCCCCGGGGMPPQGPDRFGDDAEPEDEDENDLADDEGEEDVADEDGSEDGPDGPDGASGSLPPGTGQDAGHSGRKPPRRFAFCVGIDAYARQPLSGCVADSRRWERVLRAQGFEVTRIADAQATRAGILQGLRRLIAEARPGDELVFQYAGHGSQVEDLSRDEGDRLDEVFLPFDYANGALLIDDDFHAETLRLAQGAHLTLFMDCCHSGSNSRVASVPRARGDARPRFMRLSEGEVERFRRARGSMGARVARMRAASGENAPPRVIHFAACQDHEFAWESGGQGDFTRIASALLARARREGWDNARFMERVLAGFDKDFDGRPRQRPQLLRPAAGLERRSLLGAS